MLPSLKFIKRYYGAEDFIQGKIRFCLWIEDCDAEQAASMPEIAERLEKVRNMRLLAKAPTTRPAADSAATVLIEPPKAPRIGSRSIAVAAVIVLSGVYFKIRADAIAEVEAQATADALRRTQDAIRNGDAVDTSPDGLLKSDGHRRD